VAGRTSAGPRLFAVDSGQLSVVTTPLPTLDPTRRMARVEFRDAAAVPLGDPDAVGLEDPALLSRLFDLFTIGLAAEQLGCAERSLDEAVAYAGQRTQHGQAIGSFQAIKHRCADVFLALQAARSTVHHAAALASESTADSTLSLAASVAKVTASRAATLAAAANIQIHGGIGVTWEHTAHFYLKRAKGFGAAEREPGLAPRADRRCTAHSRRQPGLPGEPAAPRAAVRGRGVPCGGPRVPGRTSARGLAGCRRARRGRARPLAACVAADPRRRGNDVRVLAD